MGKSKSVAKTRGRPKRPGGVDPVSAVRLTANVTASVDKWAEAHDCSRSEAIRRLVEIGLPTARKPQAQTKIAGDLAGKTIDSLADTLVSADDQAARKRRLLKGPKEFRDIRGDQPKGRRVDVTWLQSFSKI